MKSVKENNLEYKMITERIYAQIMTSPVFIFPEKFIIMTLLAVHDVWDSPELDSWFGSPNIILKSSTIVSLTGPELDGHVNDFWNEFVSEAMSETRSNYRITRTLTAHSFYIWKIPINWTKN